MFPNVWHRARFFGVWLFPVGIPFLLSCEKSPRTRPTGVDIETAGFHGYCLFSHEMSYPMSDGCILLPFFGWHALLSESHRVN